MRSRATEGHRRHLRAKGTRGKLVFQDVNYYLLHISSFRRRSLDLSEGCKGSDKPGDTALLRYVSSDGAPSYLPHLGELNPTAGSIAASRMLTIIMQR